MHLERPAVTVLMSVFNGERFLREAIESILAQSYTDFEFIIIDDGSTDSTNCILQSYAARDQRVVLLKNDRNVGLTKSLNLGLSVSQGTYVARQDADDLSFPERLRTQVAYLDDHPSVGLLGTAYTVIDQNGMRLAIHQQPLTDTEIRWQMLFHNAFCHTSVMWRRAVVSSQEPCYEEGYQYSQDYGLWAKLLRQTVAANLDLPLVAYRAHDASIEATSRSAQQHTATSIATQEIRRLLGTQSVNISDVQSLREWYCSWPARICRSEYRLCALYLRILETFVRQNCVERSAAARVRQAAIERVLRSLSVGQFGELWRVGLVQAMLRLDASFVTGYVSKRCCSQVKRGLRPLMRYQRRRTTRGV